MKPQSIPNRLHGATSQKMVIVKWLVILLCISGLTEIFRGFLSTFRQTVILQNGLQLFPCRMFPVHKSPYRLTLNTHYAIGKATMCSNINFSSHCCAAMCSNNGPRVPLLLSNDRRSCRLPTPVGKSRQAGP
jgi:hypothetical protein